MAPVSRNGKDVKSEVANPWGWIEDVTEFGLMEMLRVYRVLGYRECPYKPRVGKCKRNPHCLWGLGDQAWRGGEIGEASNPSPNRDEGQPAGLQNQGATCYVNSLLQLWFHNPIIRPAIFRWMPPAYAIEIPDAYVPVCAVSHFQAIFARMKGSKQRAIDTKSLVEALSLDTREHQDAQEFSKLFLAHITRTLENSVENADISSVFKTCFTGESLFETTCEKCQTKALGRSEEFNELQLPVLATLNDAFRDYLKAERLEGDNKYNCQFCNSKQNAIRRIQILKLPPVLNIQLMRFVYDTATQDRKKVKKSISFPEVLDMSAYLDGDMSTQEAHDTSPKERLIYHLNAVLIHHGTRATSGHYISHIKDLVSGGWFECNDEKIEKIDQEGYSQTLVMRSEEESGESELQANPSSKGAYMLVYTREEYFNRTHADPELPQFLADLVKREDSVFEAEQEEERKVKAMESHRRAQRQAQVDLLFKSKYPQEAIQNENRNPVANPVIHELRNGTLPREVQEGLHFRNPACIANIDFISTQWLEKWLKYSETDIPPISNEDIICGHEKLRPPRKGDMNTMYKIIPSHIADVFYKYYGGCRLSGEEALCRECVQSHRESLTCLAKLDILAKEVEESVRKCDLELRDLGGKESEAFHANKCLIGKDSLREWKKVAKSLVEVREGIQEQNSQVEDWILNKELFCIHGGLGANRGTHKRIDVEVFLKLCQYFPNAIWYGSGQAPCSTCLMEQQQNSVAIEGNKSRATYEKAKLGDLLRSMNRPSSKTVGEFFLVPAGFISNWRDFIRSPATNQIVTTVPMSDILCNGDCQNCNGVPGFKYPYELIDSVPEITEQILLEEVVMLKPKELEVLLEMRTMGSQPLCVHVIRDPDNPTKRKFTYSTEVCQESAVMWMESVIAQKYTYKGGIHVRKLEEEDFVDVIGLDGGEDGVSAAKALRVEDVNGQPRRSGRRKHHRDDHHYIDIDSSISIREFQMRYICKDFKACLSDQHLYFNRRELTSVEKERNFRDLKIPAESILLLRIDKASNGHSSEPMDSAETRPRTAERGFSGTALLEPFSLPPIRTVVVPAPAPSPGEDELKSGSPPDGNP